jgi:hypothetical protein
MECSGMECGLRWRPWDVCTGRWPMEILGRLGPRHGLWELVCLPTQRPHTEQLFCPLRPGLNGTAFPATRRGFFCGVDAAEHL